MDDNKTLKWDQIHSDNPHGRYFHVVGGTPDVIGLSFGYAETGSSNDLAQSFSIPSLQLGCSAGYFSENYAMLPCSACPVGKYQPSYAAASCIPCPGDTTTATTGTVWLSSCNLCQPGICGHGSCSVVPTDFSTSCTCDFGYGGSDCTTAILHIVLYSLFSALVLLGLALFLWRKHRGKIGQYQWYSKLQEDLLDKSMRELEDLERVWKIEEQSLRRLHRIDFDSPGAYGEVWLAQWGDLQVLVRRLLVLIPLASAPYFSSFFSSSYPAFIIIMIRCFRWP
jgi:hypothetical protein